jgi:hypothetical protein
MTVIWGALDWIEEDAQGRHYVRIRVIVSGKTTIRVRALVGRQTLITRGIERVDLSNLCTGEFVEVSYRHSCDGYMEADTIYVQPESVAVG